MDEIESRVTHAIDWECNVGRLDECSFDDERVGIKISPSPTSAACTFQAGQADCWSDPFKDATVTLVWPAGGSYTLAVTADRDKHGRQFNASKTMQLAVNVQ